MALAKSREKLQIDGKQVRQVSLFQRSDLEAGRTDFGAG